MSIDDPAELEALRAAGHVVAETLRELRRHVRPGVSTGELDALAARVFGRHGARSGPRLDYGFPGTVCLSVDDECVHGIPGPRRLRAGQLIKLAAGVVLTVEPIIAAGAGDVHLAPDGWTVRTDDGSPRRTPSTRSSSPTARRSC